MGNTHPGAPQLSQVELGNNDHVNVDSNQDQREKMTEIDRTVELFVTGMSCEHCVASVTEELQEVPGVKNVEVILDAEGQSKVTVISDVDLADDALNDAVSEAGYQLVNIVRDGK